MRVIPRGGVQAAELVVKEARVRRSSAAAECDNGIFSPSAPNPVSSRSRGDAHAVHLRLVEKLDICVTPRQLECLRWAGEGKSSVDIGSILDISAATVNEHIADACRRLKVRTRIQAIVEAYRRGWLE